MTEDELIAELEELIRTTKNSAAKIAAIKELNRMREAASMPARPVSGGVQAPVGAAGAADPFAALDEAPARRLRAV